MLRPLISQAYNKMEGLFVYRDTWLERTMEIWQSDNNIGRSMSYLIYIKYC